MRKGFTLIELLVVIAILAVLATAVVVVLNPAELLRQGRDSTRLSDLAALQSAIALYMSDFSSPDVDFSGTACQAVLAASLCTIDRDPGPLSENCTVPVTLTLVDGNGWVPIQLTGVSIGSPLARLPVDPTNVNGADLNSSRFYAYGCNAAALTYEIDTNLESTKYATMEGSDGGDNANWYEIGSEPGLDI